MTDIKKEKWKIGSSASASWAWGTSLIMGQQIAQTKGITAWIIWAVCNALTLALFGLLFNRKKITPAIYERKEVKIVAIIIQMFCLLVQLNFINQQFYKLIGNGTISYLITALIGCFFVLIVFKKGLPTSMKTDVWQWLFAIVAIIVIIAIGIGTNAPLQTFAQTDASNVLWGVWSGLILFAGPIGDVQHWQRAEADKSKKAYYIGAGLFAMYMLLILGMAFFEFTPAMDIILLVAVLCITTSTIDSIAVALHKVGNKKTGTAIALVMCIAWGVFAKMGMIDLWSSFGVIRFAFAVAILTLPFALKGKWKVTIPVVICTLAIMITFTALGYVVINSISGAVSFAIAVLILVYLVYSAIKNCRGNNVDQKAECKEQC